MAKPLSPPPNAPPPPPRTQNHFRNKAFPLPHTPILPEEWHGLAILGCHLFSHLTPSENRTIVHQGKKKSSKTPGKVTSRTTSWTIPKHSTEGGRHQIMTDLFQPPVSSAALRVILPQTITFRGFPNALDTLIPPYIMRSRQMAHLQ